jgi:hypothetical protein
LDALLDTLLDTLLDSLQQPLADSAFLEARDEGRAPLALILLDKLVKPFLQNLWQYHHPLQ